MSLVLAMVRAGLYLGILLVLALCGGGRKRGMSTKDTRSEKPAEGIEQEWGGGNAELERHRGKLNCGEGGRV